MGLAWRMGCGVEGKVSIHAWFLLWLVRPRIGPWKGESFMSTPLSGIPKSISTCQAQLEAISYGKAQLEATSYAKAQMEATSYAKAPNPCRDHLSLWCHLLPWAPTCSPTQWTRLPSALGCDCSSVLVPYN